LNNQMKTLLIASVMMIGLPAAFAEDEALEEVVVTGSYLKRDASDSPSPLSVVTAADIEDLGASDVSEIVQAMPWSSGSQSRAATFQGEGADGRNSINLRNLGHGATLPLVNGKRQVASWYNGRGNASVNVNGLIPNIALERIEIVKDGASALYGSDAIAGVVNFITKKNFEGFDMSYQFTTDRLSGEGDAHQVGVLWGVQGDRGGIVVSASNLNRDEINIDDNYQRYGGTTLSSTGQPGRLLPIGDPVIWAAHGLNPGEVVGNANPPRDAMGLSYGQADVNCEDAAALERGGALGNLFNRCVYDYGSFFSIQAEESLRKMHVDGHYDFTENVEMYFQFAANYSEFDRLNSLNPNAPALTVPFEVEYIDADGNIATAQNPGSIEDAFRRGIEPIRYANLTRMIGGTQFTADRFGEQYRPVHTFTNSSRSDQRFVLGALSEFKLADRDWTIDTSYTASQHNSAVTQVQDTLSGNMHMAINGLGGPECDPLTGTPGEGNAAYAASGGQFAAGGCYFFNVFGNTMFDRDGNLGQDDLTLVNPVELYQWLLGRVTSDTDFRQRVIDVILSGNLFETASGPVGLAIGFQRRRDTGSVLLDAATNTNNLDFVYGANDWNGGLTTTAIFGEIGIPVGDSLDINIAVRYEDFDEIGVDTTDPKITVLWRPSDSLSLRASAGSSFRVPSLQQSFGTITTVANQADWSGTTYKPSLSVGNPELTPESADNVNIGVSWVPQDGLMEGFQIDLDYYDYEYTDIITRESSSNLLRDDIAGLDAYIAANPGADYVAAMNAGAGNPAQVIRNAQAILLRILPEFANANGANISGMDLNSSYSFDTDAGSWRIGLQAAWIKEYEVQVGATTYDGVGSYNSTNPVARPLPEFKVNATLSWNMGPHRAFMIAKHVDEIESDVPFGTRYFFGAVASMAGNPHVNAKLTGDTVIESMTTVDVQYTYNFGEAKYLSDSAVSVGIMNVFDEEAPYIANVTGYDGTMHDGRGMMYFVRFGGSL